MRSTRFRPCILGAIFLTTIVGWATSARAETDLRLWHSYRGAERRALDRVVDRWDDRHDDVTVDTLA
ncbi:MAG: hypothetical protein ABEL76_16370, partial [Bradymonadaceae bacterium]